MGGLRGLQPDNVSGIVLGGHRLRRRGVHESSEFHAVLYALDARYRSVASDMREMYAARIQKKQASVADLERTYATHVLIVDATTQEISGPDRGLHYDTVAILFRVKPSKYEVLLPGSGAETTWNMKSEWIKDLLERWKKQKGGANENATKATEDDTTDDTTKDATENATDEETENTDDEGPMEGGKAHLPPQLAALLSTAQIDALEYELVPASSVIFLDDEGPEEVTVMRAFNNQSMDNYSRDQLFAIMQDMFVGNRRPAHTLDSIARLLLHLQRHPRSETDVYPASVRRMQDNNDYSGPWIWLLDDEVMTSTWKTKGTEAYLKEHMLRMDSAEPFDIRQRQLYRLHAPFEVSTDGAAMAGTRVIRVGAATLARSSSGGPVVKLLGQIDQDGRRLYDGDTIVVGGIHFPSPMGTSAASVEFDMEVYADALAQLQVGDAVHVQFLVPYYDAEGGSRPLRSLQGILKHRERDGVIKVELDRPVVSGTDAVHAETVLVVGPWSRGTIRVYAPRFVEEHGVFDKRDLGVKNVTVKFPQTGLRVIDAMMWILPTLQETLALYEREWGRETSLLACLDRLREADYNLDMALTSSAQNMLNDVAPRIPTRPVRTAASPTTTTTSTIKPRVIEEPGIDEEHLSEVYHIQRRHLLPLALFSDAGTLYWITRDAPGKTLAKPKTWTKELQLLDRDVAEASGAVASHADLLTRPVASLTPLVDYARLEDLQHDNGVLCPEHYNAWARVAKETIYYRVGDWWVFCGPVNKDGRVDLSSWMSMSIPLYLGWDSSMGARDALRAYVRYKNAEDVLRRARALSEAPGYAQGYTTLERTLREWVSVPRVRSYVPSLNGIPTNEKSLYEKESVVEENMEEDLVLDILDAMRMRRIDDVADDTDANANNMGEETALETLIRETMTRVHIEVTIAGITEIRRHVETIVPFLLAKAQQQLAARAGPDAFSLAQFREDFTVLVIGVSCAILLQFVDHMEWGHPLNKDDAIMYAFRIGLSVDGAQQEKRRPRIDAVYQMILQKTPSYVLAIDQARSRVVSLEVAMAGTAPMGTLVKTWPTFRPPQTLARGSVKGAGAWIEALYQYTQQQQPLKKNPFHFKQPYTVNTCCLEMVSTDWSYHTLYTDAVKGIQVGKDIIVKGPTPEPVALRKDAAGSEEGEEIIETSPVVKEQAGVVAIGEAPTVEVDATETVERGIWTLADMDLEALTRRAQTLTDILMELISTWGGGVVSRDDVRILLLEFGSSDDETMLIRASQHIRTGLSRMKLWISRYAHDYRADRRVAAMKERDDSMRKIYETAGPAFPTSMMGSAETAALRGRVETLIRLTPDQEPIASASAAEVFYQSVCMYLQWMLWMAWVISIPGTEASATESLLKEYTDVEYIEDMIRWASLYPTAKSWGAVVAETWTGLLTQMDEAFRNPEAYKQRVDQLREKRKQKQIDLIRTMSDDDRKLRSDWEKLGLKQWFDKQYEKRVGVEAGTVTAADAQDVDEVTGDDDMGMGRGAESWGEDVVGDEDYEEDDANVDREYDDND